MLSKIDGFWQIPLDKQSALLTMFIKPFGRYHFNQLYLVSLPPWNISKGGCQKFYQILREWYVLLTMCWYIESHKRSTITVEEGL